MVFTDRILTCMDCGSEFVFSGGEQAYFHDKNFSHDPKHCKQCKVKRKFGPKPVRAETQVKCARCGVQTIVPFKPVHGRPVFCRDCFRKEEKTA